MPYSREGKSAGWDAIDDIDRRLTDLERRIYHSEVCEVEKPKALTPTQAEVSVYFRGIARPELADAFYFHFEASGWVGASGNPIANWKARAQKWAIDNPAAAQPTKAEPLKAREGELPNLAETTDEPIAKEEIDRIRRRLRGMTGIGREMPV